MTVIAETLHCDVVRISGGDAERLSTAVRHAEALGQGGAQVVLVTGCELSAFAHGFLPGDTYLDRLKAMATADIHWWTSLGPVPERLNAILAQATTTVRAHFGGKVTYASGPWEPVDWARFDVVGVDAYRTAQNADTFRTHLREFFSHGKPLVMTEYGTCAYRGAGDLGSMAWQPPHRTTPDEDEQVRYLNELLDIFEEEGVDTALWFSFANYDKLRDRDIASYGVVRLLDEPAGSRKGSSTP
ncbi:hypothetical protein ACFVYR_31965 [Streptomyces sp. NPDC058284]|uniref:hypothetical protein n=1 Tax=unclassified Streptomyces TaxID=2593676 RepID=UPI003655ACCA